MGNVDERMEDDNETVLDFVDEGVEGVDGNGDDVAAGNDEDADDGVVGDGNGEDGDKVICDDNFDDDGEDTLIAGGSAGSSGDASSFRVDISDRSIEVSSDGPPRE